MPANAVSAPTAVPSDTQRNRRFILWGALLLAVGVLGVLGLMAWRLLRVLGAQPPPPD